MLILSNSNLKKYQFTDSIVIKIQRVGRAIASVSFEDNHNNKIKIPNQIEIYDKTKDMAVNPFENQEFYILKWGNDYSISYGNEHTILFDSVDKMK